MRKGISVLLSLLMLLTLLPAVPVLAEEDSFDAWNRAMDSVPEDGFEGDHATFDNPDGSKTHVFDNGSVVTEYPDGSQEGVDYKGNQFVRDKGDNVTTRLPDGTSFTDHADGRKSFSETNGKTTVINPDKSSYEMYARTGIVKEYDKDGYCTGMGFIGSDERIATDENGDLQNGKITGPNGASMEITDSEAHVVTPTGAKIDYRESGISDSQDGYTESYSLTTPDGYKSTWDVNTTVDRGADGVATGRTVISTGLTEAPNGEKYEYNASETVDRKGNPVKSNANVAQWTSEDGKTLWIDKNSNAMEYQDPTTGEKLIVDKHGNLTDMDLGGDVFQVEYDDEGNVRTADCVTGDGARLIINRDGSATITTPDGTTFESDGNGNVYKDGAQIKKDGTWVSGYEPASENVEPTVPGEIGPDVTEPEETEPKETEPEATEPEEEGLSAARLAGSYTASGTDSWVDYDDPEYSGTARTTLTLVFKAIDAHTLSMDVNVEGEQTNGITATDYDPATGKATFRVEDMALYATFTEKGSSIGLKLTYDYTDEDGRYYGTYTGSKK